MYQLVLKLGKGRDDDPYVLFHRAVYGVLNWLSEQTGTPDPAEVEKVFNDEWLAKGLPDQPLEPLYQAAARRILSQAQARPRTGISFGQEVTQHLDGHSIKIPIDEIETSGGRIVLRRLRTGRPPKDLDHRPLHAIMLQAGRETLGSSATFEVHYLTTNETVSIPMDRVMAKRTETIRGALASMAAGRFPAEPENKDDCPRCPHYFICAAAPD
jgi:hypothetical protein